MTTSTVATKTWTVPVRDTAKPEMGEATKLALFEQTILPHLNAAYNLARWLMRNDHNAEDVTQEAYLRAFRFFDSFKGGDGRAWLLTVVRNTCMTWRRREKGGEAKVLFDERIHGTDDETADTEHRLVEESKLGTLRECIQLLPVEYREVVVMRELEEMSYKEISEVAAVPIGTVMSRLSRARKRLQECAALRTKGGSK
jgi:RNA polymerase sigma-70 factor (ECF subfamily)